MTARTDAKIREWIDTAPGLRLNPDDHYGLQCVDLVDAYAEAIFNVPWSKSMGAVQGAKQLLDAAPDEFWIRIDNDANNPDLIPQSGDIFVFGGTPGVNDWGHTGVVDQAYADGMWAIQQDGFAQPLINVDGGWYSNKPAQRVWLPYWQKGTGSLIGWLRPREEKVVGYTPPAPPVAVQDLPLLGYQRTTVADARVGYRKQPDAGAELIQWFEPDHTYDFKGFVRRDSGIWFVGRYTDGFSKATGYTDEGTHDLQDLTDHFFPPLPDPKPAPAPQPEQPAVVEPNFPHMNGIDVSVYQESANLQDFDSDFYAIKATEGGGDWRDPALASNIAEARLTGKPICFYHYARPLVSAGNTAKEEARSFLAAIAPYLQPGDRAALDWEAENQDRTDWAEEWLDIVAAATNSEPLIYLNAAAINGADWSRVEVKCPLWFAGGSLYGNQIDGFTPLPVAGAQTTWEKGVRMWQYSGKGRLPGYGGDLDINVWYGTAEDWRAGGAKKLTTPEPQPEPTPEPAPAPEPEPTTAPQVDDAAKFAAWIGPWLYSQYQSQK